MFPRRQTFVRCLATGIRCVDVYRQSIWKQQLPDHRSICMSGSIHLITFDHHVPVISHIPLLCIQLDAGHASGRVGHEISEQNSCPFSQKQCRHPSFHHSPLSRVIDERPFVNDSHLTSASTPTIVGIGDANRRIAATITTTGNYCLAKTIANLDICIRRIRSRSSRSRTDNACSTDATVDIWHICTEHNHPNHAHIHVHIV